MIKRIETKSAQRGQALPVGIALVSVLFVIVLVLFNTGTSVAVKSRLANTADSASYSGLLWQARAMNFQAYTNRAMVANQVAMAQAVSLNSWGSYIAKAGQNLEQAFGWVPYVGNVVKVVGSIGTNIDAVLNPVSQGMLSIVSKVNSGLSVAQEAMYYSAFASTPDIINSVVSGNETQGNAFKWETEYSLSNAGLNLQQWKNYTSNSEEGREVYENERFHMINSSLDKYSLKRDWKFLNFFLPVTPLNWVRFEKQGTTKLTRKDGELEWFAKDALSLRQKRYTWRGKKYNDLPVGGGSAIANLENSDSSIHDEDISLFNGRHKVAQRRGNGVIGDLFHDGRSMSGYEGIEDYRSLSIETRGQEELPVVSLSVQVSTDVNDINDSDVVTESGPFQSSLASPGSVLSSVSTAELYFEKPCYKSDCTVEVANSYSPYWDVRLVESDGVSRLLAHTLQTDVVNESFSNRKDSLGRLAKYEQLPASPVSDYNEQVVGVKRMIANMEATLMMYEKDSPEFAEYKKKLDAIKNNITFELDGIADQYVQANLSKSEVLDAIVNAAGYSLESDQLSTLADKIREVYPTLDELRTIGIDGIKDQLVFGIDQRMDNFKETIKDELSDVLRDSVADILAGKVGDYISDKTGVEVGSIDLSLVTDQVAQSLIDKANDSLSDGNNSHDTDIPLDLSNECAIYDNVLTAEKTVNLLQINTEAINGRIADRFQTALKQTTDKALLARSENSLEIERLRKETQTLAVLLEESGDELLIEDITENQEQVVLLEQQNSLLPSQRVEELTLELIAISNEELGSRFPSFDMKYAQAETAVLEILGDTSQFVLSESGDTIAQLGILASSTNEALSDTQAEHIERPRGC